MSVVATTQDDRPLRRAYEATGSTILALGVSVILLLAGFALKEITEQRTQVVSGAGIEAVAPHGWRADSTGSELVVRHPGDPRTLMAASVVATVPADLAQMALETTTERGRALLGFQVTRQAPVSAGGRTGEQVEFAYVTNAGTGGAVELIDGVDIYLVDGSQVVVVSFEAPREEFERDYEFFGQFVTSARATGGTQ